MNKPNLFNFATSELSQDAFIAWLLAWADKKYAEIDKNLHACAVNFVRELLGKDIDYNVETVNVETQWKHIDIIAKVNSEFFILIEDKTVTSEHSNQLERYLKVADDYCKDENMVVVPIYFKIYEQGNLSKVEAARYGVFTRPKMLSILKKYVITQEQAGSDILLDYYSRLKRIDENVAKFDSLPIKEWLGYRSYWTGFFAAIKQHKIDGSWKQYRNFLGFEWNWKQKEFEGKKFKMYLRLERGKLVFRLVAPPEYAQKIRTIYRNHLHELAKQQAISIKECGKSGSKSMGIAKLAADYRCKNEDGTIDMNATIENLKKMEQLLDAVAAKL